MQLVNKFSFWAYFGHFSHKRPPPISNHFAANQVWSLTRELTVVKTSTPSLRTCQVVTRVLDLTFRDEVFRSLSLWKQTSMDAKKNAVRRKERKENNFTNIKTWM